MNKGGNRPHGVGVTNGLDDPNAHGSWDAGETSALRNDTDYDGLLDGAVLAVGLAVGFAYTGPKARTDPKVGDSDGDGLGDGMEDANRNGRVEGNETAGDAWDSDRDGLCDGNCSAKGEDLNLNGFRDQDDDGNWTETDALANDSDVDGLLDGWEVNGSWCNAVETGCSAGAGTNAARITLPLNPDTDGDGLRDGQETSGWKVLVWREITMEIIANYSVTSNPLVVDGEGLRDG